MKKITSFMAALAMILTLTACSDKAAESTSAPTEKITVTQTSYKEEYGDLPEDMLFAGPVSYVEGKGVRLVYTDTNNVIKTADYDENMNITATHELFPSKDTFHTLFDIGEDGTVYLLNIYVESDKEPGDEGYFDNAKVSADIKCFAPDGKELSSVELPEITQYYSPGDTYIRSFMKAGDKFVIATPAMQLTVGEDGSVINMQEKKDVTYYCHDSNGDLIAASYKGYSYVDDVALVYEEDLTEYGKYLTMSQGISRGYDGFKAFFMLSDGIYGLGEDDELVQVLNYQDSLMTAGDYYYITYAGKGRFVAVGHSDSSAYLSVMNVRPDDFVMDREDVTLGIQNDLTVELVSMYNRKSDKYKITTKKFADLDEYKNAVLTGDAPDGFCYGKTSNMIKLSNLGAFCDLYELSDKYGGLKREDLLDNVAQALEKDGKLYAVPQSFKISTYVGTKEMFPKNSMTWDEFMEICNSHSDLYLSSNNALRMREGVFQFACLQDLNDFIDYDNAKCSFDSEEFIERLEFTQDARLMETIDWDEYYGTHDDEEAMAMYYELKGMLKKGETMIDTTFLCGLCEYNEIKTEFGLKPDEIRLIGSPSDDPQSKIFFDDLYSVTANGNCPEGAWDFISFIMSDEVLTSYLQTESSFVTTKESFENILKKEQYYSQQLTIPMPDGHFESHAIAQPGPVTEADLAELRSYISTCTVSGDEDEETINILLEEYKAFEAGERSAKDTAKMMQDRISIYLSENYG